ncbi:exodeoxyribonuclease III [Albimonas sp. CAU 1670]|uniref:exodeoxyribonuclease III n=1 Tax=Albimonas sp. CAU 1670 TaxID=3032599 RepID=UPI0023DC5AFC|nr:exodeoxyribonuclease III [Albimonas sp. CAU 1670]MDF2231173.1 exodeoxyribonuclease III [Albimonas sp. CAU 1670]
MPFTICTWNINSVRLRAPIVRRLLEEEAPDVLCLQETKCPAAKFPLETFAELGWEHLAVRGDKGYNGVAILSRLPLEPVEHQDFCLKGDARHVTAKLPDGTQIHNLYVPAGGDEPDVETNPKFQHKLDFVDEMAACFRDHAGPAVLVGDLNIAPREDDVWNHKQLLKIVSHTPVETEKLNAAQAAGGWVDAVRQVIPEGLLYSWWSYRAKDWDAADKGRRLDHVWTTPDLPVHGARILREARGWQQPSDHAPVFVTLG